MQIFENSYVHQGMYAKYKQKKKKKIVTMLNRQYYQYA